MRKRRSSRNEDGSHEGILVVVAVQASRVLDLSFGLCLLYVELVFLDDGPARLGDYP